MGADDNQEIDGKKKRHSERKSGRKAEKKKRKNPHVQELTDEQRNPKAFAINSVVRAERKCRRTQELKGKKEHIVLVDRTPLEPPPIVVAIVGPPKVGKTTLIRSLIKSYTRQPFSNIKGPITVVSGKKRRITFMECNNDINSMVDLAKVADLVLLLIDASFGFEMEVFEFLNICQVHGMPRVMGVLTHLDLFNNIKKLQKTKKELKRRFWTEVFDGAKLFYLTGLLHNEYLRNEIKNLARFISVMKFRPLIWQTTHSYIIADRMEDITPPEELRQNPKTDRIVCLYGYMRGIPMNKESFIHVPGCGDFEIRDMCFISDPCPLPEVLKKRSLIEKERLVYAPFSGLGGIVYDKDAVYIDLPYRHRKEEDNEVHEMVHTIIESKETLDNRLAKSKFQLFSNSKPIVNEDFEENMGSVDNDSFKHTFEIIKDSDGVERRKVIFDDDDQIGDDKNCGDEETDDTKLDVTSGEGSAVSTKHHNSDKTGLTERIDDFTALQEELGQLKKNKRKIESSKDKTLWDKDKKKFKRNVNYQERSDDYIDSETEFKSESGGNVEEVDLSDGESDNESRHCKRLFDDVKVKEETAKLKGVQNEKDKEIKNRVSSILAEFCVNQESSFPSEEEGSDEDEPENVLVGQLPWENQLLPSDDEGNYTDENLEEEEERESDEDDLPECTDLKWKENLAQKASDEFLERQATSVNLWKLVYGEKADPVSKEEESQNEDDIGGLFRVVTEKQENLLKNKASKDSTDSSIFVITHLNDWSLPEVQNIIKDCFVTGKWKMEEDANELLKLDDLSDEELYGDFEDLETGEQFKAKASEVKDPDSSSKDPDSKDTVKEKLMEKKRKLKEKFDMEYDNGENEETYFDLLKSEANKQAELNKKEFEGMDDNQRVKMEGFRAGLYVRLEIQAPCELVENFDPTYPLIAGGLQPGEQNIGYLKVRIKKHRWYNKILKTLDPVILSVGWRRFQTIAVYSKEEDNKRNRMLKYTPEHVACMAHFWGPITKSGTGFLALKNTIASKAEPGFRIIASGTVLNADQSTVVTKKLKLTGEPFKIFKKSAFIKGMFNSTLEVAKFEGAKIKTVSGIRGQIKKALNNPEGAFRATFEDKILLSDIVFCRTWYKVDIPKFYTPLTTLLLPEAEKNSWQGMKTVGQLKRERCIHNPAQPDSMYSEIKRVPKVKQPLILPRALERELPYKYKSKQKEKINRRTDWSSEIKEVVVRDKHESEVVSMMNKLRTSFNEKVRKMKELKKAKMKEFIKQKAKEGEYKAMKHRQIKKSVYRELAKSHGRTN